MNEQDYEEQLAKAAEFHGHICGGIAIGTKLAMYGLELLGMELNQRHKNLIVFLEIDRCMSDAVQSVTGCSMGKRTLKQMYYGKFAATFYNQDTGEALRITDADANKKFANLIQLHSVLFVAKRYLMVVMCLGVENLFAGPVLKDLIMN